jgi:hypothetical protein
VNPTCNVPEEKSEDVCACVLRLCLRARLALFFPLLSADKAMVLLPLSFLPLVAVLQPRC